MKKIFNTILSGIIILSATSCKKYLDINNNPNQATSSTPELVLPQALTATAATLTGTGDNYNIYGSTLVGYYGNAGGYGSLGSLISYNFTTTDFAGIFQNTFDNLSDYQYIINTTDGKPEYALFNAAANVMKAYNYQMLVDTYGDVPYSEANQGTKNLRPKYDKAEDIYKDLAAKLDDAIASFKAAGTTTTVFGTADVLFKGDITKWEKFANTIKLRLIIRAGSKVAFANTTFDGVGFLETDAIVNPGYTKSKGKQNPLWEYFAYNESGTTPSRAGVYLPSPYVLQFYNGGKIQDKWRGAVTFKEWTGDSGADVSNNQLGDTEQDADRPPTPNSWFIGTNATTYKGYGIYKGPDAGQPLMLAAESFFLQAEGALKGIISGDDKELFNSGITASFTYLYSTKTPGTLATGLNPATDVAAYMTANKTKYLVAYDTFTIQTDPTVVTRATTTDEKLEAIITQKYIALNALFGGEAWNEFRRTGYPTVSGTSATTTFASKVSQASASNRLPTRILYPGSEITYNGSNVPGDINKYTTKIFWAK